MAAATGFPVANVVLYALVVATPTLGFWLLLALPRLLRSAHRRFRPPAAQPDHPPIQLLAADLRRVHELLAHFGTGTPASRRTATKQAYDALLAQACSAVEIEQRLAELPEGLDRELERLRVEESLRRAGLAVP
ncbi:hypothetical protein [Amycolatopsis sp. H20-H5]|uniref:hypothetical protein n=1 Tax=Amycolatopsis sp. H20-H5 TaxID=3046309 RepID=UPI002DBFDE45|nr:hypothetical protein [Amycolatopsis sp. H20-H5]MEC3974699.1 hypothetical protein [Amycolatopsis sp. H20-H5]